MWLHKKAAQSSMSRGCFDRCARRAGSPPLPSIFICLLCVRRGGFCTAKLGRVVCTAFKCMNLQNDDRIIPRPLCIKGPFYVILREVTPQQRMLSQLCYDGGIVPAVILLHFHIVTAIQYIVIGNMSKSYALPPFRREYVRFPAQVTRRVSTIYCIPSHI